MKRKSAITAGSALLLSIALAATGCSSGKDSATSTPNASGEKKGAFEIGKEDLTFTMYRNYDWAVTPNWADNPATKWILDNKKVTINPVQSGGAAIQKFNTMLASDSLPDTIQLDRGANVDRLVDGGKLVALDDYYNKYPNLKKWIGEDTLNMLRASDGKIYQIPNWYTNKPMGNSGYVVNQKIYKELGSPKLETYDDLYAYLKQVKEKYPDVVPLEVGEKSASGIGLLYTGFTADRTGNFLTLRGYPVGNELKSIFTDPVFQEHMLYVGKLSREKLMTQDALTQKLDQVKEKLNNGKVAVLLTGTATDLGRSANNAVKAKDPSAGYDIIWPVHKEGVDKNKVWLDGYSTLGWNVNVITKSAKNPEAIFAYFDWMTSEEGQRTLFFGPPGLYWDKTGDGGVPIPNDKYLNGPVEQRNKDFLSFESFNWAGNTGFIDKTKSQIELSLPKEKQDWSTVAQTNVSWKTSKNITEFVGLAPKPDSEEGIVNQRVTDIYNQMLAKILFSKSDDEVKSLISTAGEDSNKAGLDKLLKFETDKWQANLKKMQGGK